MKALSWSIALCGLSGCSAVLDIDVRHCRANEADPRRGDDYVCVDGFWQRKMADAGMRTDGVSARDAAVVMDAPATVDTQRDAGSDAGDADISEPAAGSGGNIAGRMAKPSGQAGSAGAPVMDSEPTESTACRGPLDPPVFRVDGRQILDAAGCPFVPYGYNAAMFFIEGKREEHFASLQHIASASANAVRIVATTSAEPMKWWNANPMVQRQLVAEALRVGLVPILDMHDFGACEEYEGDPSVVWSGIRQYWLTDEMVELAKSQPALWLNLASRMPFADADGFFTNYRDLVTALRAKGVNNLVVIDAGAKCGQDETTIVARGQQLLAADPRHNIVFAVHPFAEFGDNASLTRKLEALHGTGLATMIGAFSWDTPVAESTGDQIFYETEHLLRETERLRMGWMFWSWFEGEKQEQRAVDLLEQGTLNSNGLRLQEQMRDAPRARLTP